MNAREIQKVSDFLSRHIVAHCKCIAEYSTFVPSAVYHDSDLYSSGFIGCEYFLLYLDDDGDDDDDDDGTGCVGEFGIGP